MNYQVLKDRLKANAPIVITTHRSPDGDAIGSGLALYLLLKKAGHSVSMVLPDAAPAFLHWMKGYREALDFETQCAEATETLEKAALIFALDYNKLDRVGDMGAVIKNASAFKAMVDHHIHPSKEFDWVLSDVGASSTAELVYRLAGDMGWLKLIDKDIAECIYTGIMTDTGSFRFSSTTSATHRIAGALMDAGMAPDKVHSAVYDNYSFERLQLIGFALSNKFEYMSEMRVGIISLSLSEKNRFKYQKGDTEGLVNYGLSVEGSRMAVFLSEELNMTKFSFRSKGEVDVNVLASKHFNGGGHKNAAGGRLDMKIKPALKFLKDVLQKEFKD